MASIREKAAWSVAAAFGLVVVAGMSGVVSGGPLNPTNPPGPTMKTLQEVEPRTPISALPTTISVPGSYYLTGNLTGAASQHGIIVSASNVTIDLNGFTLTGGATSFAGITTFTTPTNVRILNGTVASFPNGQIRLNAGTRIVVDDVTAVDAGSQDAIELGAFSTVTDCVVDANTTGHGITVDDESLVSGCIVRGGNRGIAAGPGSRITDCAAHDTSTYGVNIGIGGTVEACTVTGNLGHGILAEGRNLVSGNHIDGNGLAAGNTCGIQTPIAATGIRIVGNHITNSEIGVCFGSGSTGSSAHGNTLRDNTLGTFTNVGTNDIGPEQTAGAGTSPWANIVIP